MCGINGIAFSNKSRRTIDPRVLVRMRDIITHRGPDDDEIFIDRTIGLGHRRLSIVDVAAGHQPMTNEDGSLHITYKGEIYNHDEYVLGERAASRGLFDHVRRLVARHQAGENHTERLWALVNFEMWQRQFIDGEEMLQSAYTRVKPR